MKLSNAIGFIILAFFLSSCGGFEAVKPSGNEIIHIRNEKVLVSTIEDEDLPSEIFVMPMPNLEQDFKNKYVPNPDKGKIVPGTKPKSLSTMSDYGVVKLSDLSVSPFNASGYLLARSPSGKYFRCSGQFIGEERDVFVTAFVNGMILVHQSKTIIGVVLLYILDGLMETGLRTMHL